MQIGFSKEDVWEWRGWTHICWGLCSSRDLPLPRRKKMLSSLTSLVGHTPPYSRNRARVTFHGKETPISPLQSCKGFWRIPVLVTGPCCSWWLQRRWASTQQDFKQDRVQDNWPAFPLWDISKATSMTGMTPRTISRSQKVSGSKS